MKENNYLGQERVGKLLLKFAVPSTLALMISCLYNIVDQIFVGSGVGCLGNAVTGNVFPVTVVGWGASVLFGDGCAMFLQSTGHAKAAVPLSVLRDVLLIVLAIILPMRMGIMGILWSAPVTDLIAMFITAAVAVRVWKRLGQDGGAEPETDKAVFQKSRPGVIITFARKHGSAGKRVGRLVAQQLNIPCCYKEMTALAAQESGLSKEFIFGINSGENAVMRELYLSTSAVRQAVSAQEKAIRMIAGQEWGGARRYERTVGSSIGAEKTAGLICDYIGRME